MEGISSQGWLGEGEVECWFSMAPLINPPPPLCPKQNAQQASTPSRSITTSEDIPPKLPGKNQRFGKGRRGGGNQLQRELSGLNVNQYIRLSAPDPSP